MESTASRVRAVARKSSAYVTLRMKRITARAVRPAASFWPTVPCRVCCAEIGRARSKNLKSSRSGESADGGAVPNQRSGTSRPVPQTRRQIIVIHAGDYFELDLFGTDCGALADVGAASKTFGVVLRHHAQGTAMALGLTLR